VTYEPVTIPPDWARKVVYDWKAFPFGSRSMAARKDEYANKIDLLLNRDKITDWDYSLPYNEEILKSFERSGFEWKVNPHFKYMIGSGPKTGKAPSSILSVSNIQQMPKEIHYADSICVGVLQKEKGGEKVDVVLHSDEQLFRRVWNKIGTEFYYNFIWKSSPDFAFKNLPDRERPAAVNRIMNQLYWMAR